MASSFKRPWIVWQSALVLAYVTGRLWWIAAQIPSDPRFLLGNREVVGLAALGTVAFFFWPRVLRWVVAPYFILSALGALPQLKEAPSAEWMIAGLVLALFQGYLGVRLFALKKDTVAGPLPSEPEKPTEGR